MSTRSKYAIGLVVALIVGVALIRFRSKSHTSPTSLSLKPINSSTVLANPDLPVRAAASSIVVDALKGNGISVLGKNRPLSPTLERALEYREARKNVNFDERSFIVSMLKNEALFSNIISDLKGIDYLLSSVPSEEFYFKTKPKALMARMAEVDLLRAVSEMEIDKESVKKAQNVLRDLVAFSIPRDIPEHIKKILVSEKYDALSIIAQYDPESALTAFKSITNPVLRELLASALDEGFSKATDSQKVTELRQELARFQSKT